MMRLKHCFSVLFWLFMLCVNVHAQTPMPKGFEQYSYDSLKVGGNWQKLKELDRDKLDNTITEAIYMHYKDKPDVFPKTREELEADIGNITYFDDCFTDIGCDANAFLEKFRRFTVGKMTIYQNIRFGLGRNGRSTYDVESAKKAYMRYGAEKIAYKEKNERIHRDYSTEISNIFLWLSTNSVLFIFLLFAFFALVYRINKNEKLTTTFKKEIEETNQDNLALKVEIMNLKQGMKEIENSSNLAEIRKDIHLLKMKFFGRGKLLHTYYSSQPFDKIFDESLIKPTNGTYFKLEVYDSNNSKAYFSVHTQRAKYVINSHTGILYEACLYENNPDAGNYTSIETIEEGEATKEEKGWKITKPAKIKFS